MEIAFKRPARQVRRGRRHPGNLEIMASSAPALASLLRQGMNKIISKTVFKAYGLQVGTFLSVSRGGPRYAQDRGEGDQLPTRGEAQLRRSSVGVSWSCAERL